MNKDQELLESLAESEYEYGFTTDIEMEMAPVGLNEDTIRYISNKKNEPEWLYQYRLKALKLFFQMKMPEWQNFEMPKFDFQEISYYAAPKNQPKFKSLDEVDPELLATYEKLSCSRPEVSPWMLPKQGTA